MKIVLSLLLLLAIHNVCAQADSASYLHTIKAELVKEWPKNRAINLVFHGHSVPAGYFNTPNVRTLEAYPQQVLKLLKAQYPYAVINCITTAIGGENSVAGEKRFAADVLTHKPDVLFIDYALNDRYIDKDSLVSLRKSYEAMEKMIRAALAQHIKVILLTPSPDQRENTRLPLFSDQVIALAKKYNIGLVDSYAQFKKVQPLVDYMSQSNHPNEKGHALIAAEMVKWF